MLLFEGLPGSNWAALRALASILSALGLENFDERGGI